MIEALIKISGSIFIAGVGLLSFLAGILALFIIIKTIKEYMDEYND